jgi:hypothetical protein
MHRSWIGVKFVFSLHYGSADGLCLFFALAKLESRDVSYTTRFFPHITFTFLVLFLLFSLSLHTKFFLSRPLLGTFYSFYLFPPLSMLFVRYVHETARLLFVFGQMHG